MSDEPERLQDMAVRRPSAAPPRLRLGRRGRDAQPPEPDAEPPRPYAETRLEDLVVITGYSGAGKSTAMNVFEDAGYFCVDNLPPEMIRALVELFVHEGSKVERAAVVSDVRGGDYFEALRAVLEDLEALGLRHRVLFLHATDDAHPHALPGDAPAPPAGRGVHRRARHRPGARGARAHQGPGRRGHRLHRA